MSTAKEDVRELLDRLPADATLEQIQYHLFVQQKIAQAREQADAGQTIDHEEAERRLSKWLAK